MISLVHSHLKLGVEIYYVDSAFDYCFIYDIEGNTFEMKFCYWCGKDLKVFLR